MFHFIWKHEEFLSIKNHRPKPFIIAKDIIKSGKPEEVQIRDIMAHEQHDFQTRSPELKNIESITNIIIGLTLVDIPKR